VQWLVVAAVALWTWTLLWLFGDALLHGYHTDKFQVCVSIKAEEMQIIFLKRVKKKEILIKG
jgi:hypothetical protein